jgi:predicted transcriptional regulator
MKNMRIRLNHSGLRASLFDLEAEIMDVVWSNDWAEFAVSNVQKVLGDRRDIAYTTVMTTVVRLHDKGLLSRHKHGRKWMYTPIMTRAGFIETMTREVLDSLPPIGRETAMALLVEQVDEADDGQLERLEALIQSKRAARGGDKGR